MTADGSRQASKLLMTARSAPRRVLVAGALWMLFGAAEVAVGVGSLVAGQAADAATADSASAQLGDSVDAGVSAASVVPGLIATACGVAMIVLTVLLVAGKKWSRLALELVGTAAVISLAMHGQGLAVVAMVLLVLATVPTMSVVTHRYLYGGMPSSADNAGR